MSNNTHCNSFEYSDTVPSNDSFIDYAIVFQNDPFWMSLEDDDKVEYLRLLDDQYSADLYYRKRIESNLNTSLSKKSVNTKGDNND
jgi:hypothetical protein